MRLGDDAFEHLVIHPSREHGLQEDPRVSSSQGSDVELGQPAERLVALPGREQQADPLRQQPPSDERERPSRRAIEPLGVVDHTEDGLIRGSFGQQTQDREPDEERVRRVSGIETERDGKGLALRIGQARAQIEDRQGELLERGVGQLRLSLDAGGANAH